MYIPFSEKLKVDNNGRFKIINAGEPCALPGKCLVSDHVPGDGVFLVDIGLSIQRYGRIYFCNYCFDEFARAFKYIKLESPAIKDAETYIEKLEKELDVYKNVVISHEGVIHEIERFHSIFNQLTSIAGSSLFPTQTHEQDSGDRETTEGESREEASSDNLSEGTENNSTSESDSESRSADLYESASSDDDFELQF